VPLRTLQRERLLVSQKDEPKMIPAEKEGYDMIVVQRLGSRCSKPGQKSDGQVHPVAGGQPVKTKEIHNVQVALIILFKPSSRLVCVIANKIIKPNARYRHPPRFPILVGPARKGKRFSSKMPWELWKPVTRSSNLKGGRHVIRGEKVKKS